MDGVRLLCWTKAPSLSFVDVNKMRVQIPHAKSGRGFFFGTFSFLFFFFFEEEEEEEELKWSLLRCVVGSPRGVSWRDVSAFVCASRWLNLTFRVPPGGFASTVSAPDIIIMLFFLFFSVARRTFLGAHTPAPKNEKK